MANKDLAMKQRQAAMKRSEKNAPSQPQSTSPARADRVRSGGQTTLVTDNKKKKVVESGIARQMIKKLAKIDTLPKTVSESIPIRGVMPAGIIETTPGTFTKSYLLHDVSFSIATEQEQFQIFNAFASFLNTFNEKTRWQFNIYNHEINKKRTMANIRIAAQKDGLNPYRQEMNNVLLDNLKMGNNSIKQDKILTVAIDDINAEHAVSVLRRMDAEISRKLRPICKVDTVPMTSQERLNVLYQIYNQDSDYRLETGFLNNDPKNEGVFDLRYVEKCGLSVKDIIGPTSMDWSGGKNFMLGDTYGQAMYLKNVPSSLSTAFLEELSDIQCNLLISTYSERINSEKAIKLVKNKLSSIEASATAVNKRNNDGGVFAALPPELERKQETSRELLKDLTERDQNLFDMTFLIVVFARTLDQLEENVKLVKEVGGKYLCPIQDLRYQQEKALNSALPLCRNDVSLSRLYTTESAAVFIPFSSQEINQKNAIFYGLNQITKSMILYDRTSGDNYNGLIFGMAGSGKSFTAKLEMVSVLLGKANAQVFVIDPQGEYYPLAKALRGQEIELRPGSRVYINPLDLDISENVDDEDDPISMKVDFIISIFEIVNGTRGELDPAEVSILDQCVRKIYQPYLYMLQASGKTSDLLQCPTLGDLYQELREYSRERYEARGLADKIYPYAAGTFDTFAHRTNVETNARFVVYNTKYLGAGMRELGLHICTYDIWNRMIINSKRNVWTWFYIDEFHILLESDGTTKFLRRVWKMARKWMGVPTGIMQNTEDLLRTADTRAIINNSSMIIILNEPLMDRQNLQELLSLSNSQVEYINNAEKGHGLIYTGKIAVPFGFDFPKNTKLYSLLTTAHDVEESLFA
ncbi:MAG: DUF87 domain-containing protein [Butyrivibrio sp.]|uniref:VirB4-like conjugal transfer ATPase, CD1110 family n=1 Tax=Butyrivibrio sp. TaxID=28121 RepID=UPI001B616AF9|nr:DUF87 domain-containing protein [Butyrivibrio sp.]MBP3782085.1 DUF87 domain-containing protein [Butyrivibrio sp.]